ncbi:MAG: hypothetical protein IJI73_07410 [Kiritimatiellae bacterium]|nr:hypothetical protein [Kiritimatiellia bacterium]
MNRAMFFVFAVAGLSAATALSATVSPTGNATNDTQNIQSAIDAAQGGVVTLAVGTYSINKTIEITNGASLIGDGSNRGAVVLSLATTPTDLDRQSVLSISGSTGTVVSNLTVTGKNASNGGTNYGPAAAVIMNSGILVDCSVEDNKTKNGVWEGGGIRLSGDGTVRNCTITRCEAFNSAGNWGPGEAIYMTGGLVENCIIVSNAVTYACNALAGVAQDKSGGTVYISGGTLRGCLIADNVAHRNGSGVSAVGGVVESCTIAGNRNYSGDSDASGLWVKGTGVVLRNNIIWGNTAFDGRVANFEFVDGSLNSASLENNDTKPAFPAGMGGNTSVDPMFVDAGSCDYRCRYSYCVDAGANQSWMADAVDLDGNARIINGYVDMGCYEREAPSGFVCRMSVVSDEAPDRSTVALGCEYSGCPSGTAEGAYWVFTRKEDGAVVEATGFAASVELTAGTWDAALTVRGGGQAASFECEKAVFVKLGRVYANVNGLGEYPYDTVEKGFPSIKAALGWVGTGGTLYLARGSYVISSSIRLVDGGCTRIVSLDGPENTIVRMSNDVTFKSDSGTYGLQLLSGSAYVSGLTLVGGRPGDYYTGESYKTRGLVKVEADGAMVTNCVFRDQVSRDRIYESGLSLSAGTVVDCLFTRLESFSSGAAMPQAGVICVKGGLADRIRVEDCIATASNTGAGGRGDVIGVWGNGVMRNSLVTRCSSEHDTPVYVGAAAGASKGGFIENCTIVANTNLLDTAKDGFWYAAGVVVVGGSVTNCIIADNWSVFPGAVSNVYNSAGAAGIGYTLVDDRQGDAEFATAGNHNVVVSRDANVFRKPDAGNYTLATGSPALNSGLLLDWMEAARDLSGGPRVVNRVPDLGCYEGRAASFSVRMR